jgi:E3 ubiquitin-protein ligase synoviolin
MASALNASTKYFLSLYELRRASQRGGENAPPWENKSMWVFYIELSTGKRLRQLCTCYTLICIFQTFLSCRRTLSFSL